MRRWAASPHAIAETAHSCFPRLFHRARSFCALPPRLRFSEKVPLFSPSPRHELPLSPPNEVFRFPARMCHRSPTGCLPFLTASVPMNGSATDRSRLVSAPDATGGLPPEIHDDLLHLAMRGCEVHRAGISLASDGMQVLGWTLGQHVAETTDLLLVPDATKDPRFDGWAEKEDVRFLGLAPLFDHDGILVGVLWVADRVPRILTPGEEETLRIVARQVIAHREIGRQNQKEEDQNRRFRALVEGSPDGMGALGADGKFREMNAAGFALIGGYHGESLLDLVLPIDRAVLTETLGRVIGGERATVQFRLPGRDNGPRWVEMKATPYRDRTSGEAFALTRFRDIGASKLAEENVLEAAEESDLQGVVFADDNGKITAANDAFLQMVGYSRDEMAAGLVTWTRLCPATTDEDGADLPLPLGKLLVRKDGSHLPVICGTVRLAKDGMEGFTLVLDLSARKHQELQYLRAHRIESIRTLARGISHDLNNVFAPIVMALDLLKMRFPDSSSHELISIVEGSAQRGAHIVKQVTAFARGMAGQRVDVPVRPLLDDLEVLNSEALLRDVQVIKFIPRDVWSLAGDPEQLAQAFSLLCENAHEAMPNGGRLTISAANLTLDESSARMHMEAKPGPYVLVQVADTGHGISAADLERIFDPYFTTKSAGRGTGLGLSVVHSLVKSHGGFIRTFSELRQGTTFKIYLPASGERIAPLPLVTGGLPRGHGEWVLLVDDEAPVRLVTRQLLENFGYQVMVAADGCEALEIHGRQSIEIAAVVTDIMMPRMDGVELVGRLRNLNPRLPIIAASGVPSKAQDFGGYAVDRFLAKPYDAGTLLHAVAEVLRADRDPIKN